MPLQLPAIQQYQRKPDFLEDLLKGAKIGSQLAGMPEHIRQQRAASALQLQLQKAQTSKAEAEAASTPGDLAAGRALTQAQTKDFLTKSQFTPAANLAIQQSVQNQKNQQAYALAQAKAKSDDPLARARIIRLDKDMGTVNETASEAAEVGLPLLNQADAALASFKTRPGAGLVAWATPEGQLLKSKIMALKLQVIKTVHIGRMTQLEFNKIGDIVGSLNYDPEVLKKIFGDLREKLNTAVNKQHYYSSYVAKGGRNPDELASNWLKTLSDKEAPHDYNSPDSSMNHTIKSASGKTYTRAEVLKRIQEG